ncbi:hypothetical protein DIURU_002995 [Diutina rugosa]|uniref:GOLD domain-containing protein n=1 Tax=Diutina rugosa TaxID=5481 RepID=A0A642UQ13_DIURU|nr:uncharacterized protein DIURU_002995 [Diutina rugosa]KAA8902201.1 hypothetical protein DIURU_002995 [Diutina rugosa]
MNPWQAFLLLAVGVWGLGLEVPPVKQGDRARYSSINNLANCVGYETEPDEIVVLMVSSGDVLTSQDLAIKVFDDQDNLLQYQRQLEGDKTFIFSQVHGAWTQQESSSDIQLKRGKSESGDDEDNTKPSSRIYVCFDNIYTDKSWSFTPQVHEVEIQVDIKTRETIAKTNYDSYAQYFDALRRNHEGISEEAFDDQMNIVQAELASVINTLDNSGKILEELIENESALRNTNERIFEDYTGRHIVLYAVIGFVGLAQVLYLYRYFRKTNIV